MTPIKLIEKVSVEGRLANNLIFILCDIIETLHSVAEYEFQKAGLHLDAKTRNSLLQIKWAAKDLRRRTREVSDESQDNFGEEADTLLLLILLIIDRTGDGTNFTKYIKKHIDSFPSLYKIKLKMFGV